MKIEVDGVSFIRGDRRVKKLGQCRPRREEVARKDTMRLRTSCMKCLEVDGQPPELANSVELRDDGLYEVTCSRGHVTVTAIQEQKFEILFDLGAMALLDGYTREAVSSTAASLERFFEYYILVVSLKHGITYEQFSEAWAPISKQSERQIGAFLFFYLVENKKPLEPLILEARPELDGRSRGDTPTWSAFRNDVIHKGYIPSAEEVIEYGNLVYQFTYRLIGELKASSSEFMTKATFHHLQRAQGADAGQAVATMSVPTLVSLVRAERPSRHLREALPGLEKYRRWLYDRPQSHS